MRIFLLITLIGFSLQAGEINDDTIKKIEDQDKASAEAKKILLDPKRRQEAENSTPEARAASKTIKKLAGNPETEQKLYLFANDIFQSVNKKTKGNSKQMESILREALTNPEAFAEQFSPEQKKMLRELADQITGGGKSLH